MPFPLLADTVRFNPGALLSAGGISGVGPGSTSHGQGGRQVFLSLQTSQQRDFCPVADSQAIWFMWFSSHTMALPSLCSGGVFAPRVPDLCTGERLTLVKRGGGCVQQQQLRSPLRGCSSARDTAGAGGTTEVFGQGQFPVVNMGHCKVVIWKIS